MAKVNEQIEAILKLMDQSADLHNQAWLKLETLRKEISGTLYNTEDYEDIEEKLEPSKRVVPFMTDEFMEEYIDKSGSVKNLFNLK